MGEDRLPKQILESFVGGKRGIGGDQDEYMGRFG